MLELAGEGLVHGPAHSSIGQEGGAVGSIVSLRSTDAVNGSHRGHHQFLAKAITHVTKGVLDPADLVPPEVQTVLQRTLAEILGLAQGFCSGRGGSMHLQWFEAGALGTNAIVGGGVPMAAGHAWAQKHAGTDDLTVTYFGDGAVNIGSVLESLNLAVRVAAAALLLHREQPLRRLDQRRGGHRGAAAVGARARLRHPGLAGRRHGPARRAPRDAASAGEAARGRGPGRRRGARLPLLPPERPLPRQRLRLPHQGRRGRVARPRPARPRRGRDDQARPHRRGGRRFRPRAGAAGHEAGRRARSSSRIRTPSPAPAASALACGPTPPSSTSASAATSPNSPVRARSSSGTSPASSSAASSSTPWPGSWTGGWARIRASSCSARTCTA